MFKKYLAAVVVLMLALVLVACGGTENVTDAPEVTDAPPAEHVHNFVEEIIPATCTETGKIINKCECGEIESEKEIPLADHTPSALDCEKDTVCTVCNAVLAEKTGHIFAAKEVVTPATCTAVGKEKGSCVSCGKVVENEIPATGHTMNGGISIVDGAFKSSCSVCSQAVTLTAQEPVFFLDFEEDVATQAAKYDTGLTVYTPEKWLVEEFLGSNAFKIPGNQPRYINIDDASKLSALGSFVISFDYASTVVPSAGSPAASAISILNNNYNGAKTEAGSIGWGWMFKIVENGDKGYIATVNSAAALTSENSFEIERGVSYKIQIVISAAEKATHVFVNGTYIGSSNQAPTFSGIAAKNATFRFGDGPDCGHVVDNFSIAALK